MEKITQSNKIKGTFSPIIVIGGSAGGLTALATLIESFKKNWNASIFVVLHVSQKSTGTYLIHHLQPHTSYTCKLAEEGDIIKKNHIYIAPPNAHLLIKPNRIAIGNGPPENRWRPSVDVLFRSAAAAYDSRVVGIILTGMLDDGTSGMEAIKKSGGLCMVQDPEEAEFPDMPNSVIQAIEVDYVLPLAEMGQSLTHISKLPKPLKKNIPREVIAEARLSERASTDINDMMQLGEKSLFSCPDCGGGLWEMEDKSSTRYRCHIGHVYSEKDLILKQRDDSEKTLWVALRMMEERKNMMLKLLQKNSEKKMEKTAAFYKLKVKEIDIHIQRLKNILFDIQKIDGV